MIIFLTKISELFCKVMDVGGKGRTILIFWYSFVLFVRLICVGGGFFAYRLVLELGFNPVSGVF